MRFRSDLRGSDGKGPVKPEGPTQRDADSVLAGRASKHKSWVTLILCFFSQKGKVAMRRRAFVAVAICLSLAILVGMAMAQPGAGGGAGQGARRGGGAGGAGGGGGGMRGMGFGGGYNEASVKQVLGVNDQQWEQIKPKLDKVRTLTTESRTSVSLRGAGRRGGEDSGAAESNAPRWMRPSERTQMTQQELTEADKAAEALLDQIEKKDSDPKQIQAKVEALRCQAEGPEGLGRQPGRSSQGLGRTSAGHHDADGLPRLTR